MVNEYGGNSGDAGKSKLSSNRLFGGETQRNAAIPDGSSSVTLDEAIQMHLIDCDQCRRVSITAKPVAIGQKSGHCDTYWAMMLLRAEFEGKVNNIVAHNEYGDEAPKRGRLE